MAMTCTKGKSECDGCMSCRVAEHIGYCAECHEPIEYGEEYYDFGDEMIHEDCLSDWAEKYRR